MADPYRSYFGSITRCITRYLSWGARLLIYGYQLLISPVLGPCCRFYPSCSHYALEALQEYSFCIALAYIVKRMIRCGPWSRGGYDPLPVSNVISELQAPVGNDSEMRQLGSDTPDPTPRS